jgi:hypothetical protein
MIVNPLCSRNSIPARKTVYPFGACCSKAKIPSKWSGIEDCSALRGQKTRNDQLPDTGICPARRKRGKKYLLRRADNGILMSLIEMIV